MSITELLESMPKFDNFKFWFRRVDSEYFDVIQLSTDSVCGRLKHAEGKVTFESDTEGLLNNEAITADFVTYMDRPEYSVGQCYNVTGMQKEDEQSLYNILMAGTILMRSYESIKDPDVAIKLIDNCLKWLNSTDFYEAPASTQYHESYPGGLVHHTLQVYNQMCKLHVCQQFKKIPYHSATYVVLTHDWCKIGLYEIFMRNNKNEVTGKWEKVPSYKHNLKGVPLGHGVTSMYLASKICKLSVEETLAIRWHMGAWNVAPNEMNDLQMANEKYPLVHMLQFSDCLSITDYIV